MGRPSLCAIAVLLKDDHVLLAQRGKEPDRGLWGFPGGHVELGETGLEAAVRELREETGVTARALDYLTNIDVLRQGPSDKVEAHFLLAAVLCTYVGGTPVAADDAEDAAWIPVADVLEARLPMSLRVDDLTRLALAHDQLRRAPETDRKSADST